jgi:periplasmic mercuric ion binding protein
MRSKWFATLAGVSLVVALGAASPAETKVEVKGVHLCCGACVKGVTTALKGVDGASASCNQKAGIVAISAKDEATAQKALDALTGAGYFGTIDATGLTIKPVSDLPTGKVKSIKLSNSHNCCRSCGTAIQKAVKSVPGVSGNTVQPKKADFEVTGDFDAAALVKALNDAGFQVQVK